jgi:hypothetical protein
MGNSVAHEAGCEVDSSLWAEWKESRGNFKVSDKFGIQMGGQKFGKQ